MMVLKTTMMRPTIQSLQPIYFLFAKLRWVGGGGTHYQPYFLHYSSLQVHYIVLHCCSWIHSLLYFALYFYTGAILYFVFDFCISVHLSPIGRWPFVWLQTCFLSPRVLIGDRIKSRANSFVSHSLSFGWWWWWWL